MEGGSKSSLGIGPLMRADPTTLQRAIIVRDIPSRRQALIAPTHRSSPGQSPESSSLQCPADPVSRDRPAPVALGLDLSSFFLCLVGVLVLHHYWIHLLPRTDLTDN